MEKVSTVLRGAQMGLTPTADYLARGNRNQCNSQMNADGWRQAASAPNTDGKKVMSDE